MQGKIGAAPIPGVSEAYDPIKGTWSKYPLNQAGNVNGGSWHCVISRFTQNQEATYDFLAFMANRKNAFYNVTHGFTGVQPGMRDEYLPPAGTATLAEWHAQGWNEDDAKAFMDAYYANLALPTQEPYLRIPGAADYWHQLDIRLSALLAGQTTPQKALDDTAAAWEEITNRYGREQQRALYLASFCRMSGSTALSGTRITPSAASMRSPRRRPHGDELVFKYLMLGPAILWVIGLTFFPLANVIRYSFANYILGRGITGYVGFANYAEVLHSAQFWNSILITVIYVGITIPLEIVLGFLLAWVVNLGAPGTRVFRALITSPLFTMEVAIGYLGITLFSSEGGLVTWLLGKVGISIPWLSTATGGLTAAMILEVWRWTPFVFLLALAALASIPEEIYDAAVLDCETHWQAMRHIAIPLSWPVMSVAILLRLIEGFKAFGLPFAITSGGPGTSTQLFSIYAYLTTLQFFDFGHGSAMGIVVLGMISILVTIFFRQMRRRIA